MQKCSYHPLEASTQYTMKVAMHAIKPTTANQDQSRDQADPAPLWSRQAILSSAYINRTTTGIQDHPEPVAGPLSGVGFAVKDNIHTCDLPTTAGSDYLRYHQPARDAAVVHQLRAAGGHIVGKTNMHELGLGITSDNAAFGPARNPFNPLLSAGGSSGGSAIAVAMGDVPFALGTDTGGSARIPAAYCGIYGFRPTTQRYSDRGLIRVSWTRDTIGILANSLRWIRTVDRLLTGQAPLAAPQLQDIRLGVCPELFQGLHPEIARISQDALHQLSDNGVQLIEIAPAFLRERSFEAGFPIIDFETDHLLSSYLNRLEQSISLKAFASTVLSPDVRTILENLIRRPVSRMRYDSALDQRSALQVTYEGLLSDNKLDALVLPATTRMPPRLGNTTSSPLSHSNLLKEVVENATLATIVASPSLSLPVGLSTNGLPVGLMLDGPTGHDGHLLAVSAAVGQVLARREPLTAGMPRNEAVPSATRADHRDRPTAQPDEVPC